jgi:hypothetical protein
MERSPAIPSQSILGESSRQPWSLHSRTIASKRRPAARHIARTAHRAELVIYPSGGHVWSGITATCSAASTHFFGSIILTTLRQRRLDA